MKEVYDLWADTVNRAGGIKIRGTGYPVRLTYYDDESSPQKNAQLVERLATSDKVDLMLGAFGSSVVVRGQRGAEKYKYPYISGAPAPTRSSSGLQDVFATLNKTFDEVEAAARVFSLAQPKPTKAAVIGADHLFGKLSAEGFKKFLGEMGIEVVHFEIFPVDLTDYNSIMLKVKRQSPTSFRGGLFVTRARDEAAKEVTLRPRGSPSVTARRCPSSSRSSEGRRGVIAASRMLPSFPFKDPVFGSAQGLPTPSSRSTACRRLRAGGRAPVCRPADGRRDARARAAAR